MKYLSALILLLMVSLSVSAVIETYEFSTPALEQRYRELSAELRCPKCQNQNIADSNAPIAQDLRKLLHEQLESGASDEEILDYMVARYGEFVRYRPRYSGATALLWLAPFLLLLCGGIVVVRMINSQRQASEDAGGSLDLEQQRQLETLLNQSSERDT